MSRYATRASTRDRSSANNRLRILPLPGVKLARHRSAAHSNPHLLDAMTRRQFAPLAFLLASLGACDGFPGSDPNFALVEDGELIPVKVAPDAPPLETMEATFWIVRGQWREVEIRYATDGYNGKCIRFIVPPDAPLRHADGRVFEMGDSALVTLRVIDPELYLFEFDPEGMRFNPAAPARVEIRYRWIAADANGDGRVDAADGVFVKTFSLWRQERSRDPWVEVPSERDEENQEIHADVDGFTRYMLASD
jgi:hypothetical protein